MGSPRNQIVIEQCVPFFAFSCLKIVSWCLMLWEIMDEYVWDGKLPFYRNRRTVESDVTLEK